jgi:formamidopyrimidine-DNA glycosylase
MCFVCPAGVGNIYRAEILYKTGLHPEQPGHTLDRDTFDVRTGTAVAPACSANLAAALS